MSLSYPSSGFVSGGLESPGWSFGQGVAGEDTGVSLAYFVCLLCSLTVGEWSGLPF